MPVNVESERMWKEAAVAYSKVPYPQFRGDSELASFQRFPAESCQIQGRSVWLGVLQQI